MQLMTVQLQRVQIIADKTNAADLSSAVLAINFNECYSDDKNTKSTAAPQIASKICKRWRNKGSTELYCLFISADRITDAICFIRRIVLWSQNKFSPNLAPAGCEISQIWYNPTKWQKTWMLSVNDNNQWTVH